MNISILKPELSCSAVSYATDGATAASFFPALTDYSGLITIGLFVNLFGLPSFRPGFPHCWDLSLFNDVWVCKTSTISSTILVAHESTFPGSSFPGWAMSGWGV
jgi:hypothetical protein